MPGMMDTILNCGLNDTTTAVLAKETGNPEFAYDSYRRLIQMFGDVVLEMDAELFEHALEAKKAQVGAKADNELKAADLQALIKTYKAIVLKATGKPFPDDPREQLVSSITARRPPLPAGRLPIPPMSPSLRTCLRMPLRL